MDYNWLALWFMGFRSRIQAISTAMVNKILILMSSQKDMRLHMHWPKLGREYVNIFGVGHVESLIGSTRFILSKRVSVKEVILEFVYLKKEVPLLHITHAAIKRVSANAAPIMVQMISVDLRFLSGRGRWLGSSTFSSNMRCSS